MAYETATANNATDLLDKLRTFAIANGWTVTYWSPRVTDPSNQWLILQQAGCIVSYFVEPISGDSAFPGPSLHSNLITAFDGSKPETQQPGISSRVTTNYLVGPFQSYHFFAGTGRNGPYIYVVVETGAGVFKHFGFGIIDKQGEFENGAFLHGSNWDMDYQFNSTNYRGDPDNAYHAYPWDSGGQYQGTVVRADRDAVSPAYAVAYSNAGNTLRVGFRTFIGWTRPFIVCSPSVTLGVDPFGLLNADVTRPSGQVSAIGAPPDMRTINMTNFDPKEHVTYGGEEWILFPAHRKNGVTGEVNSGIYGYAYKVTP